MGSFHETGEFGGRKKGDVARSTPANDHGFLPVHNLMENAGQIFTEAGVRGFTRHEAPNWYFVQDSCTEARGGSGVPGRSHRATRADLSGRQPSVVDLGRSFRSIQDDLLQGNELEDLDRNYRSGLAFRPEERNDGAVPRLHC
jgi:hypothetical protein